MTIPSLHLLPKPGDILHTRTSQKTNWEESRFGLNKLLLYVLTRKRERAARGERRTPSCGSGQALEKAQNGNGRLLEKVGMDLGLAPRWLGFGAMSAWGSRRAGLGSTGPCATVKAIRAKKSLFPKKQRARRRSGGSPFYHPRTAFRNPVYFLLSRALVICGGSKTIERSVLPQTLRRPAPNFLAAASFWQGIASRYFWLCHVARLLSHANFF